MLWIDQVFTVNVLWKFYGYQARHLCDSNIWARSVVTSPDQLFSMCSSYNHQYWLQGIYSSWYMVVLASGVVWDKGEATIVYMYYDL